MRPAAQIAQFNIARLLAPIDSAALAPFVEALDRINGLAEMSPGFVWRFVGEGNDATSERPYADAEVITNLGTWTSRQAVSDFTYRTDHVEFLRRRREFFTAVQGAMLGLWAVPAGHRPTMGESRARLDHMTRFGPSAYCYGFRGDYPELVIERTDLLSPLARELILELNADIEARYEEEDTGFFQLDPEEVRPESGGYFVAWLDGKAAGCGACRTLPTGEIEFKRMYTRPEFRGYGIGKAMVSHLIGITRDLGIRRIVLETGPAQPEAIAVYKQAGFTDIPLFGQYLGSKTSLCLALNLPT